MAVIKRRRTRNNTQNDIDRLMRTIETILKKYIQTVIIGYKNCVSSNTVAILSVLTIHNLTD